MRIVVAPVLGRLTCGVNRLESDKPWQHNRTDKVDRFDNMKAFLKVAEAGSFAGAARQLGLAKSVISKRIDQLETQLGVRLLNRTTRLVSLTDVGAAYFEHSARIIADVEETELALGKLQAEPKGLLRLSAPTSFGMLHLGPAVCAFQSRYPQLAVEMILNDGSPNPSEMGHDLAIWDKPGDRGQLGETRLVKMRRFLVASPGYLERRGHPARAADLSTHDCIHYSFLASGTDWQLISPSGKPVTVRVRPRFSTNNGPIMRAAALAGNGIAKLPSFLVGPDVRQGSLVRVLPDHGCPDLWISAVYPHARRLSAKVVAFIDALKERFGPEPEWDRGIAIPPAGAPPIVRDPGS